MITAVHTLVYADDAEAARAFFRDVLGWPHVEAHGGWLIFKTGPSELGVHPTSGDHGGKRWSTEQHHEISLMCDDITGDHGGAEGEGCHLRRRDPRRRVRHDGDPVVPGAGEMLLYQPKHPVAHDL